MCINERHISRTGWVMVCQIITKQMRRNNWMAIFWRALIFWGALKVILFLAYSCRSPSSQESAAPSAGWWGFPLLHPEALLPQWQVSNGLSAAADGRMACHCAGIELASGLDQTRWDTDAAWYGQRRKPCLQRLRRTQDTGACDRLSFLSALSQYFGNGVNWCS